VFYVRYGKRAIDIVGATAGLFLLGPVLFLVAIAVRLHFGRPVLFRQVRPGIGAALFTIYKFRTMRNADDRTGRVLPDAERLTKFGRWLRSTSLDELPELWNVVRGQMSLVGPRPLLPEYLPRYSEHQSRRHEVRPGITGWAQVNGRNELTWDQKFELDVWYVDHISFPLDLTIMWRTLINVIARRAINSPDSATAPEFLGTRRGL
jgi:lipopolysaccharide/colanic/teichoic acid biosynthesis glycosyltransferase